MPPLGAHMSIAGGVFNAPGLGREATCEIIQIFTKSSNQWKARELTDDDVERFFQAQKETGVRVACAHDSYLINLASPDAAMYDKSVKAFAEEMKRCDRLGIGCLVMHPGSHLDSGEETGLKRIAAAFNTIMNGDPDGRVTICLETTAGQGTNLGYRFEQLARIIELAENRNRLGVCLDTCHIFAAGYPITSETDYRTTIKQFDKIIGLDRLQIIHFNDSKREFGSRVDRHEHIGRGHIGKEPFAFFLNDRRLGKIPMILETPKESAREDIQNLKILRSLITPKKAGK